MVSGVAARRSAHSRRPKRTYRSAGVTRSEKSTGRTLGPGPPVVEDGGVPTRPHDPERHRRGAYFTPPALVEVLVRDVLGPALEHRREPPRVIDPACGDGRLLAAAGECIAARFGVDPLPYLAGVELDPADARTTASRLGVRVLCGDARTLLDTPEHRHAYDVVLGNPPYLSQLSSATARGGRSHLGGGPYADVAAEFLALSLRLVRPEHGRIGLVLPMSVLASQHVAPIRRDVGERAGIEFFWWSDTPMFEANVRTCILGLRTGAPAPEVRRSRGAEAAPIESVRAPHGATAADSWSWLVVDAVGIPALTALESSGTLADLATATADFRDQYYGLVGCVHDDGDGPPLITSGLIDPARSLWGERTTVFAKQRLGAPRVCMEQLDDRMRRWASGRLVPKVLVASQTRVLEAVVDEQGEWLPSVPVVSVLPHSTDDLWRVAAVLTSPVASAHIANRRTGSGLSARALRVTASDLHAIPLPVHDDAWDDAARSARAGDVAGTGAAMMRAYGCAGRSDLLTWWLQNLR